MKSIAGKSFLLILLAASCVRGKRVIRAAEHAEKTGCYIVKLRSDTSHEVFDRTLKKALSFSDDATIGAESKGVLKFFTVKLSEESLDEVCSYGVCMQYIRRIVRERHTIGDYMLLRYVVCL